MESAAIVTRSVWAEPPEAEGHRDKQMNRQTGEQTDTKTDRQVIRW